VQRHAPQFAGNTDVEFRIAPIIVDQVRFSDDVPDGKEYQSEGSIQDKRKSKECNEPDRILGFPDEEYHNE